VRVAVLVAALMLAGCLPSAPGLPVAGPSPSPTGPVQPVSSCRAVAIVGDSLTAQGNGALHTLLPDATINARGGRTTLDAVEAAQGIVESNDVDCWVFALGTNDLYWDVPTSESRQAITDLLAISGPDHVMWVLVEYGPGQYAQPNPERFNDLIPTGVITVAPNVATSGSVDGVHLTPAGYIARAEAIVEALP
jgi:hypothetical protein